MQTYLEFTASLFVALLMVHSSAPAQSSAREATSDAPARDAEAKPEASTLSLDELIERLPKADCERRYDRSTDQAIVDQFAEEFGKRLESGSKLSDEQWIKALTHTGAITVWPRWPVDCPFAISMSLPEWLGLAQIRATSDHEKLKPAEVGEVHWGSCGTYTMMMINHAKFQRLGELPLGKHTIVFAVEVERGTSWTDRDAVGGVLWRGSMPFEVEVVPTIDEAVPPISDPETDLAVRESIGMGFRHWWIDNESKVTAYIVVDPDTTAHPALAHTALSLRVEVLHDGEIIEERWLVASRLDQLAVANSVSLAPLRFYGSNNIRAITASPQDRDALVHWSVRVRGVSSHVLGLWDAKQRWNGEFEMPILEAIDREIERTGPEGRGPEVSTPHLR